MTSQKLHAFFFHDFKNAYIPHILKEIYLDKVYTPYLNSRVPVIVDLGGNIGLTSHYFSDYADQVYCIEPSFRHRAAIAAMVQQNDIKNIAIVPIAIAATTGTSKFYHNQNSTMYSLKDTVNNKDDYEMVDTMTMKDFMEKYKIDHIDLLKFDCEGSENDIIVSDGFAEVADKIDTIVGEVHSWNGVTPQQFSTTLMDLGFKFEWLNKSEASLFVAIRL